MKGNDCYKNIKNNNKNYLVFAIDELITDMVVNNFNMDVLDKYAFIDIATRETFLLSKKDLEMGIIPNKVLYATMIPSAFCLIHDHIIEEAGANGQCGYIKQHRAPMLQSRPGNWHFVATMKMGNMSAAEFLYTRRFGIDEEKFSRLKGVNTRSHRMNSWSRKIAILSKNFWKNSKQWTGSDPIINPVTGDMDYIHEYNIENFCNFEFGYNWKHTPMEQNNTFVSMVYNLKSRPFEALDQMNYIFFMLNGLSHNVAIMVNEISMASIRDAAGRLISRNRINDILYRNMNLLSGEIGVTGNCNNNNRKKNFYIKKKNFYRKSLFYIIYLIHNLCVIFFF